MIDPARPDFANTPASAQRPPFAYAPADPSAAPVVSIVTPFYNTGAVFDETARSVLRQSLQQWEWLIVNDGSTDPESLSVLDHYRGLDPRLRVLDLGDNQGASAARNQGVEAAQTDYIVQLDADDLLEPRAIEEWLWFLVCHPEYAFVNGYTVGFGAETYLWNRGFAAGSTFLTRNLVSGRSMIRRSVYQEVGGCDEANRQGLIDWDLWLRCANAGYWGATIPEFHDWYRRRRSHQEQWANWRPAGKEAFTRRMRQRYPRLWQEGGFPRIGPYNHHSFDLIPADLPAANMLRKEKPRLLMIVPWLQWGGSDKFNLDLVRGLSTRGWEITIATTLKGDQPRLPDFTAFTPDVFILDHFLRLVDYPRFLRYLIASRQPDAVLISNSEFGYRLLPYLRSHFPQLPILDYCHMEADDWKDGGYPGMSADYEELLNLTVVSSEHLKHWMVQRGADGSRIKVCYTNVDPDQWRPDQALRQAVRHQLNIAESLPVILFAARLVPQKQPPVLAQTLLRLQQEGLHFVALVGGTGQEEVWLRSFVDQHRLRRQVRLLGAVTEQRMQELMAAADIFFLPSRQEGISLAVYEAMASGLAVVSADVGGQHELVTPECGFLVTRSDEETEAEQYAAILADLIRSPEQCAAIGRAGRERVMSRFRLADMVDAMASLVDEARASAAARPTPVPTLALGNVWAADAVELARLTSWTAQLLSQTLESTSGASTLRQVINALPRPIRRPIKVFLLWCAEPDGRLAPLVDGLMHIIPLRVKITLKRAVI
jgi:glycosyltransferase involved in cell wall biosynthesis